MYGQSKEYLIYKYNRLGGGLIYYLIRICLSLLLGIFSLGKVFDLLSNMNSHNNYFIYGLIATVLSIAYLFLTVSSLYFFILRSPSSLNKLVRTTQMLVVANIIDLITFIFISDPQFAFSFSNIGVNTQIFYSFVSMVSGLLVNLFIVFYFKNSIRCQIYFGTYVFNEDLDASGLSNLDPAKSPYSTPLVKQSEIVEPIHMDSLSFQNDTAQLHDSLSFTEPSKSATSIEATPSAKPASSFFEEYFLLTQNKKIRYYQTRATVFLCIFIIIVLINVFSLQLDHNRFQRIFTQGFILFVYALNYAYILMAIISIYLVNRQKIKSYNLSRSLSIVTFIIMFYFFVLIASFDNIPSSSISRFDVMGFASPYYILILVIYFNNLCRLIRVKTFAEKTAADFHLG